MFTGIIQSLGVIENINSKNNVYTIKTELNFNNINIGSSVSCDGVCLTIINLQNKNNLIYFDVNVGEETLKRSNLIFWKKQTLVNLEKSLKIGDELSGHFVYGHVDTTLEVKSITKLDKSWEFEFFFPSSNNLDFKKLVVEKGSIAINGISLTIANVFEMSFNISIIPHTYNNTNFSKLNINDKVNIEFDTLAKYIKKYYDK